MLLQKMLGFDSKTMKVRTEIVAGCTTFLTMCYILAVNPTVLSTTGMDKGALFTATAIASAIATLLLAFMAKLPFAQAPSMGLNAFFAFTLSQAMGYNWEQALAIMLIEGVIFLLITFINVREMILDAIPTNLRHAISVGIGMFIAFIGLKNAEIIVPNDATFVSLGKFTPTAILGTFGIVLSGVLMARKVKGALFFSIIITTLVGIPLGVTEIPDNWFPISMPQDISPVFCQFDFNGMFSLKTAMVVVSLLLVNIFDTVGTLVGLAYKTHIVREDGSIPHIKEAMMSDAIGTTCGAFLGSSTLTTYVESASGIAEGGRSGLTSFTIGLLFLISLFLAPIFMLIPGCATSGALVLVGVLMLDSVKLLDLKDVSDAFPAFITMITMVLCYSIADGICLGILSYVILKLCTQQYKALNPTLIILAIIFVLNFIFE
ncbi:NCS2 family permease [Segatella albensis]|jgi:AGZA family xanthine/uracil permease-like MFS transporter|uniref:NCS2 family permease n=1 Tax=Segatella albensis TaxID=77768 RepID=UPI00048035A3|nr:NCS2 family permease [Segatella albensis]